MSEKPFAVFLDESSYLSLRELYKPLEPSVGIRPPLRADFSGMAFLGAPVYVMPVGIITGLADSLPVEPVAPTRPATRVGREVCFTQGVSGGES